MDKKFLQNYFKDIKGLIEPDNTNLEQLVQVKQKLIQVNDLGHKTLIFGNGGSAAMASHFSVDLTKNAGIRCVNFNESDLITCFANDYGFNQWVGKAIEFYADEGDMLILISSSGKSENMINAIEAARTKNLSSVITFSGFEKENPLIKGGDVNFWVNSRAYNFIENIHQIWLLSLVDLIIGEKEYSA